MACSRSQVRSLSSPPHFKIDNFGRLHFPKFFRSNVGSLSLTGEDDRDRREGATYDGCDNREHSAWGGRPGWPDSEEERPAGVAEERGSPHPAPAAGEFAVMANSGSTDPCQLHQTVYGTNT